jgi:molybdopterin molybdotransferase
MIPFHESKSIIKEQVFTLASEMIPLNEAGGRVLAQDIIATFPSPLFDNSAMDGFAVRSEDTKGASSQNPVQLTLAGISSAGQPSYAKLGKGECIQCMTGAKIPDGADAIIMVEDSSGFSNTKTVQIMLEAFPGKHIRNRGEEIKEGEILIQKGMPITPSELGTCATFGYGNLSVFKKPKIAIFGTGDELVEPGSSLGEGQIYNSNLYVFSELANRADAEITMRNVIKDNKDSLRSFLSEALETCDIVISSGGVSMGKYDYVRDVFMELGVEEHFWKVAQKPGKPLFFGTGKNTLIFGLPGNPVSSYIGFMEWVWPVIHTLTGQREQEPITAILKKPFPREKVKYRFLFGKAWMENGQLVCEPSSKVGSHMLTSSLQTNCILGTAQGDGPLQPGESISVHILPWKSIK